MIRYIITDHGQLVNTNKGQIHKINIKLWVLIITSDEIPCVLELHMGIKITQIQGILYICKCVWLQNQLALTSTAAW